MRGNAGQYRRTRLAGLATLGAFLVTVFATSGSAQGAPAQAGAIEPGRGLALAETQKVDPRAGGLSLGITTGRSIAGHQNTVAQASSQAYDYGVIGQTAAGEGCDGGEPTLPAEDQPSAIQVDSRAPDSTQEADEDKVPAPARKYASANPTPYGEAVTTTGPMDYGLLQIGGGVSRAHSGLVEDGAHREAVATVDISGITIPIADVSLSSLHWEAVWRSTDPENGVKGVFSIGSASIAGNPIPTTDPTQALLQINGALAPLGFALKAPQARKAGDVVVVDPMGIAIFQSTQRDAIVGGILGNPAVTGTRGDVFAELLEQDCGNATYITIFDIVFGSLTGAGSFSVLLGGAQASSGEAYQNAFCLGCNGAAPSLGVNTNTNNLGVNSTTASTGTSSAGGASFQGNTAPAPTSATPATVTKPASFSGKRGGALAGVGLAGLAMMALAAEGDRRKMRRAQREIPQFQE